MRLITFNLHPTFSRLARTVVLALCLFDTFVAALPTGQEPDQPDPIIQLQLVKYQSIGNDNKVERVLCLDFGDRLRVCSPSSSSQWDRIGEIVDLGEAYFVDSTYVEETLRQLRQALAKCNLQAGDAEQEIWKCFDGLADILSKSPSGLQEPHQYVVSDTTMDIWAGFNIRPAGFVATTRSSRSRCRDIVMDWIGVVDKLATWLTELLSNGIIM
ncbi:hypothetical protein F5880DRAFT_919172 [Lentinula raphanica]|nr:hypothetical protein F5880DRAFT_919172 [Lentinula raphanica]